MNSCLLMICMLAPFVAALPTIPDSHGGSVHRSAAAVALPVVGNPVDKDKVQLGLQLAGWAEAAYDYAAQKRVFEIPAELKIPGISELKPYWGRTIPPLYDWKGFGFSATWEGETMIAFKGTSLSRLTDLVADVTSIHQYPVNLGGHSYHVGYGFYQQYRSILAGGLNTTMSKLNCAEGVSVRVVGHSLGGAMANICAVELANRGCKVELATFGSPRVFSTSGADSVQTELVSTGRLDVARWVNYGDPVPSTVSSTVASIIDGGNPEGFKHIGNAFVIEKDWISFAGASDSAFKVEHQDYTPYSAGTVTLHFISAYRARMADGLTVKLGPGGLRTFGGAGGDPGQVLAPAGKFVVSVTIRSGIRVDAMKLAYSDGTASDWFGGDGGTESGPYRYPEGITSFQARAGAVIDAVGFNRGTLIGGTSGSYGQDPGRPGQMLIGFIYRSGGVIDQLSPIWGAPAWVTPTAPPTIKVHSFGGDGGDPGQVLAPAGKFVVSVTIRSGRRLDAMKLAYSDGTASDWFGGDGGTESGPYSFPEGITSVQAKQDADWLGKVAVNAVGFNHEYLIGHNSGKYHQDPGHPGYRLIGFNYHTGAVIDELSPIWGLSASATPTAPPTVAPTVTPTLPPTAHPSAVPTFVPTGANDQQA